MFSKQQKTFHYTNVVVGSNPTRGIGRMYTNMVLSTVAQLVERVKRKTVSKRVRAV